MGLKQTRRLAFAVSIGLGLTGCGSESEAHEHKTAVTYPVIGSTAVTSTTEVTPTTTTTLRVPTDDLAELQTPSVPTTLPELTPTPDQLANQAFIEQIFQEKLIAAGFSIAPPTYQEYGTVNLPNQLIVTKDGFFGSQFTIDTIEGSTHKIITFSQGGLVSDVTDGRIFGPGQLAYEIYSRMVHQEGTHMQGNMPDSIGGQTFDPYTEEGIGNAILFIDQTLHDLVTYGVTNR